MVGKKTNPTNRVRAAATNDVDAFMAQLEHPRKVEIATVRALILNADTRIHESIKWNAPSFAIVEHFATFKLRPTETLQVVFHTGAKVKTNSTAITIDDPAALLTWAAKDRCVATLSDLNDMMSKQAAFVAIVQQWIAQL